LNEALTVSSPPDLNLVALDDALSHLAQVTGGRARWWSCASSAASASKRPRRR
jgi:hypothetical protein